MDIKYQTQIVGQLDPQVAIKWTDDIRRSEIPLSVLPDISALAYTDVFENTPWTWLYFNDSSVFTPAKNAFNDSIRSTKGTQLPPAYTYHLKGTVAYKEFWNQERDRCLHGYVAGGVYIPGEYYFYLNYCRIIKLIEYDDGRISKEEDFPDFTTMDYLWFLELERTENPTKFGFPSTNKKPLIVVKARRKGWSFKNAAGCVWQYSFFRRSRCVIVSELSDKALGTFGFAMTMINHINQYTEFRQPTLKKTHTKDEGHIQSGWIENVIDDFGKKTEVKKGKLSSIETIVTDKPNKTSGIYATRLLFEEAGESKRLKDAFRYAEPTMRDGEYWTGLALIYGCLAAGSKVWTADGREVNIEDLKQEDGILGHDGTKVVPQTINWFKPPAEKTCYRITTTGGNTLECSEDHPFLCGIKGKNRRGGKKLHVVTFQEAKDLKVGDRVYMTTALNVFGNKHYTNARTIGLLIGDGYYGKGKPAIGTPDGEVLDYIKSNHAFKVRESKSFITKTTNQNYEQLTILDESVRNDLKDLGIYGQVKFNKRLPSNIHEWDKESLAELIGGYYDADGNICHKNGIPFRIVLTSVCEDLLKDVKSALLRFGIHSNLVKENRNTVPDEEYKGQHPFIYRLYIAASEDIIKFKENIKFLIKSKQDILENAVAKNTCKYTKHAKFYTNPLNGKDSYLDNHEINNLRFERVTKVENIGEKTIYNLNCSPNHTYIANGFITRQTGGEASQVADFADMYRNPKSYGLVEYKNIYEENDAKGDVGLFISELMYRPGVFSVDGKLYKGVDDQGNPHFWVAELLLERERESQRALGKKELLITITQKCKTPTEAFMIPQGNIFPTDELRAQYSQVIRNQEHLYNGTPGKLIETGDKVIFEPLMVSPWNNVLMSYPRPKSDRDKSGELVIYEHPKKVHGQIPQGAYICNIDTIRSNEEGGESDICIVVLKTTKYAHFIGPSELVAIYFGKPTVDPIDKSNYLLWKLAKYYNAYVTHENDASAKLVREFFIKKNSYHMLLPPPNVIVDSFIKNSKTNFRPTGHSMGSTQHIEIGELLTKAWLLSQYGETNKKGDNKLTLESIKDKGMLEELINYSRTANTDRVSALMGAVIQMKALENKYSEAEVEFETEGPGDMWQELFTKQYGSAKQVRELEESIRRKKAGLKTKPTNNNDYLDLFKQDDESW